MARPKKLIPSYRKHRGSGQAVCTIAGKDHYLGPYGTKASHLEYDRLIAEWLASGRSASFGSAGCELVVVELVVDYLRYAKRYYGEGSRGEFANMKLAAQPLKRLYGKTLASEFGPTQLKAIRQTWIEQGGSRVYINQLTKRLVRIFRWAAGEGKLPAAVPAALAMVPGLRKGRSEARETKGIHPVDPALVEATLPHLSSVVRAMVELQQLTGARPGEICKLKAGEIDRSGDVWEATLEEHKTAHHGRGRTIYIGPRAQVILLPFLLRPADAFCFSAQEAVAEHADRRSAERATPLSCGNRAGTNRKKKPGRKARPYYDTQTYARAIKRACEANGIDHWTPNQLRHLVATNVRREFDLDAAKTLLGHSQVGTTEIYAEKDRSKAIQVAAAIG